MIKKTLATMMIVSAFSVSSMSFAGNLEQNMNVLAKNYKTFNASKTATEANTALDNMRQAANDAKKVKLKGRGDAKAPTSDQLYDQLITQIDKTQAAVKAGHLDHAKMEGKKIAEIRDQGHKIYH